MERALWGGGGLDGSRLRALFTGDQTLANRLVSPALSGARGKIPYGYVAP